MIEWPSDDVCLALARSFANVAAAKMRDATGMKFEVKDDLDGCSIETSDQEAVKKEFGDGSSYPMSWSVNGLVEAERVFSEQPQSSL
jgi:hypothetical protein